MRQERFLIGNIPAILLGDKTDKVYLFVHGQGGSKDEAIAFANIAVPKGLQVLGIDLPGHGERTDGTPFMPQNTVPELESVYEYIKGVWNTFAIRANSIGAWLCMLAFQKAKPEKCLFVSPVLDMEALITDMMCWASVTEEQLREVKEIKTDFGQTLSWDYLCYVRQNPIKTWNAPMEILYAEKDNLIRRETVSEFAKKFHCGLTVMEDGEHWFHTPQQLAFMAEWELRRL